jgi:DNA repair protein RecO (recombination protein O)
MEWQDDALVLGLARFSEWQQRLIVFTPERGLASGMFRFSTKQPRPIPGSEIRVTWRGRLPEQLGQFTCEPLRPLNGEVFFDKNSLEALQEILSLLRQHLAEYLPMPTLFSKTIAFLRALGREAKAPGMFVQWKMLFLAEMGFGLDLERCAVTGSTDDLIYISPRTGRAVSRGAGAAYAHRLLPFPGALRPEISLTECWQTAQQSAQTVDFFIKNHIFK